jgi:N-acyl-D-aspartate/D-glutamate deacylase
MRATRTIDASNLIVAPGFIDVHTHIEGNLERLPTADNFLQMGVTSLITGNCGSSVVQLGDWIQRLEKMGIAINVASLIGHNSVRHDAMQGDFDRPPTTDELQTMRDLVERAMKDGAVGFSTGLEYVPGTFAKTDEIVELARVSRSMAACTRLICVTKTRPLRNRSKSLSPLASRPIAQSRSLTSRSPASHVGVQARSRREWWKRLAPPASR